MQNSVTNRYQRQIIIPEHGIKGQKALAAAKVLIVGAGGLGSPIAVYLSAAGVGTIGIIDFDIIEKTNLHRQVFYDEKDIGRYKVEVLKEKIQGQNSEVRVQSYNTVLDSNNALDILKNYDIVVDGSDNFGTRYLVNDACVVLEKPLVFGAIYQYEGQVSVFNLKNEKGETGVNYRDIFPNQPNENEIPNCNEGGVIGVLPGIIGGIQAMEAIKIITGTGETLQNSVLTFDTKTMEFVKMKIKKNYDNSLIDLAKTDYKYICIPNKKMMKSITVQELKNLKAEKADFQLIDVRELEEYQEANMGAQLMPLSELHKHINEISDDKMVIIHCRSGARSASAIDHLTKEHGFDNLYNLEGGILAWMSAE